MLLFDLTDRLEIFGLISAFILMAGLYQVGTFIFKIKPIGKIILQISEIKYQKIFISTNFLLIIIYPLILFSKQINFIPIIGIILFCFGLFNIVSKFKKKLIFSN